MSHREYGTGGGCGLLIAVLIIGAIVGSVCWPYTINTWLEFAGRPSAISHLQGAMIGIIPGVGQFSIPAAFITWIIMLFLK